MTTDEQAEDAAYIANAYAEALTEGRARMALLKLLVPLAPLEESYEPLPALDRGCVVPAPIE